MRILHDNGNGGLAITAPAPAVVKALVEQGATEREAVEAIAQKDVPKGVAYEIVAATDVPTDRAFRDAWEHDTSPAPEKVRTNMAKAKAIAHEMRRAKRAEDFKPLDIEATIPALATKAEAKRQAIRDADAKLQIDIDNATTERQVKGLLVKAKVV